MPDGILEAIAAQILRFLKLEETEVGLPVVEQHQPGVRSETREEAPSNSPEDIPWHITPVPKDGSPSYPLFLNDPGYETATSEQGSADVQFNNPIKTETSFLSDGRTDDDGCSDITSITASHNEDYAYKIASDIIEKLGYDPGRGQPRVTIKKRAIEGITDKLEKLLKAFALKVGHSLHDGDETQINRDVMVFVYRNGR